MGTIGKGEVKEVKNEGKANRMIKRMRGQR
jgi:hypothetical protein